MNSKIIYLLAGLCAVGATSYAATNPTDPARVTVGFDHPEKFTDVRSTFQSDSASSPYLQDFTQYIEMKAVKYLPEGQSLAVTFTDIDLAGDFEPWRGPSVQDVRIIKAIYIPRLKFDYKVTDASGATVKEGHANLTDLNFQDDIPAGFNSNEPLRYEKRLLDDWFHDTLKEHKKK